MNGVNFTERTRGALAMARDESVRLHHEYVGTEHILLGLLREGGGVAIAVLRNLGIDPDEVAQRVEKVIRPGRPGSTPGPELPYTSRAKRVLEEAIAEAQERRHPYVGTEHLLLGILREDKGIAAQILVDAGLTLDAARTETVRLLGSQVSATDGSGVSRPSEFSGPDLARSLDHVELILYYRDGNRLQGSFGSAREAASFLERLDPQQER